MGLGVVKNETDGKLYITMQVDVPGMSAAITLANEDDYMEVVNTLMDGLKQVSRDMRKAKSGLHIVKEVPRGYKPEQGRV
jgi:hypothetical protein